MQPKQKPAPFNGAEKRTHPRIERDEIIEVHEDENAHLWAVSYSDFLMALLSFFILFYSVDEPQRDKLIMNLTADLAKESKGAGAGEGQGPGKGAGRGEGLGAGQGSGYGSDVLVEQQSPPERLPANFIAALKGLDVKIAQENDYLVVNFPDGLFDKGGWKLGAEDRVLLTRFLTIARPYAGKFNMIFEGHTDSAPLVHHRNKVITDNFVLSSLRASNALQVAKDEGYDEKYLFTQANSSNVRNSRSLSVRLERRKETL